MGIPPPLQIPLLLVVGVVTGSPQVLKEMDLVSQVPSLTSGIH